MSNFSGWSVTLCFIWLNFRSVYSCCLTIKLVSWQYNVLRFYHFRTNYYGSKYFWNWNNTWNSRSNIIAWLSEERNLVIILYSIFRKKTLLGITSVTFCKHSEKLDNAEECRILDKHSLIFFWVGSFKWVEYNSAQWELRQQY